MLRRRPIARLAVGTAVVAGTAGAVSNHMAQKQASQAPAQEPSRLHLLQRQLIPESTKSWRSSGSSTKRASSRMRSLPRRRRRFLAELSAPPHGASLGVTSSSRSQRTGQRITG